MDSCIAVFDSANGISVATAAVSVKVGLSVRICGGTCRSKIGMQRGSRWRLLVPSANPPNPTQIVFHCCLAHDPGTSGLKDCDH